MQENPGTKHGPTDVMVVCSDGVRRWAHKSRVLRRVYYVECGDKRNPRHEFGRLETCWNGDVNFVTCLERGK